MQYLRLNGKERPVFRIFAFIVCVFVAIQHILTSSYQISFCFWFQYRFHECVAMVFASREISKRNITKRCPEGLRREASPRDRPRDCTETCRAEIAREIALRRVTFRLLREMACADCSKGLLGESTREMPREIA